MLGLWASGFAFCGGLVYMGVLFCWGWWYSFTCVAGLVVWVSGVLCLHSLGWGGLLVCSACECCCGSYIN